MKLKELKPVLTALQVNLYLEYKNPIKFESNDTGAYRKLDSTEVVTLYIMYSYTIKK